MSKRPRAARSTKHQRPARPAGTAARVSTPRVSSPVPDRALSAAAAEAVPAAQTNAPDPRPAPTRSQARSGSKPSGLLAARAANEYVYVAQDLRRIGTFAGIVAAIMVVVWVLVDLARVVAL